MGTGPEVNCKTPGPHQHTDACRVPCTACGEPAFYGSLHTNVMTWYCLHHWLELHGN